MADNVAITAGAGTNIATDDIGGVQHQRVKTQFGADGSATDVSTTNPLPVRISDGTDQATLNGGGATTVEVGSALWYEADVPGVVAAAYAIGDQFGTLITIANAARFTGGGGVITSVLWHDNDDLAGPMDIMFFNDTLTLAADNAVFAISDADARKALWIAQITYLTDLGAQRFGAVSGIAVPYFCTGTSLYAAVITRTAFTPTGTGQRLRICFARD